MPTIRPLNQSEIDLMQKTLDEFTTHFNVYWKNGQYRDGYYVLLHFCYYEGHGGDCCGDILGRAAPFALGDELVREHKFEWAVQEDVRSSRLGVTHARLAFLDLFSLEDGHLIAPDDRKDWYENYEQGEATCDSLRGILALINGPPSC